MRGSPYARPKSTDRRACSCCSGLLPSSSASSSQLALVVYSLDAGIDMGLLILVGPAGWYPFGEPVGVDAAGPAFLQEMGVVVSAEQGEIV